MLMYSSSPSMRIVGSKIMALPPFGQIAKISALRDVPSSSLTLNFRVDFEMFASQRIGNDLFNFVVPRVY